MPARPTCEANVNQQFEPTKCCQEQQVEILLATHRSDLNNQENASRRIGESVILFRGTALTVGDRK